MKLSDFIMLNAEEKKLVVLHEAVLIAKRRDPSTIYFLFQMDPFYVEASFDIEEKGIKEFRMFHTSGLLEPYLEEITIDELLP